MRAMAKGLKPIAITPIDGNLEDEDLIEMVNAGLLPYAVVDGHKATIWSQIFPNAVPRTISSSAKVGTSHGQFARIARS